MTQYLSDKLRVLSLISIILYSIFILDFNQMKLWGWPIMIRYNCLLLK